MGAEANSVADYFGKNLRMYRRRVGFSQEELALRASLHRSAISKLERGGREPRLATIVKVADALSIPLDELLRGIKWQNDGRGPGEPLMNGPDPASTQ
jgi:transcriptional regulator with XRE-family HTH domain